MFKLLPAVLAILFLVGCAPTSIESSTEIATEENQTADNFARNLKCLKLRDDIKKRIAEDEEKYGWRWGEEWSLEEIFYSPKENACLYVRSASSENKLEDGYSEHSTSKSLWNVLSDGPNIAPIEGCFEIYSFSENSNNDSENGCDEFDQKITEYKN